MIRFLPVFMTLCLVLPAHGASHSAPHRKTVHFQPITPITPTDNARALSRLSSASTAPLYYPSPRTPLFEPQNTAHRTPETPLAGAYTETAPTHALWPSDKHAAITADLFFMWDRQLALQDRRPVPRLEYARNTTQRGAQ